MKTALMILCLIFFLVPESVRELNVDSADSDKVTINWQPPETDAGITKYKVMHSIQPIIEHFHVTRAKRPETRTNNKFKTGSDFNSVWFRKCGVIFLGQ